MRCVMVGIQIIIYRYTLTLISSLQYSCRGEAHRPPRRPRSIALTQVSSLTFAISHCIPTLRPPAPPARCRLPPLAIVLSQSPQSVTHDTQGGGAHHARARSSGGHRRARTTCTVRTHTACAHEAPPSRCGRYAHTYMHGARTDTVAHATLTRRAGLASTWARHLSYSPNTPSMGGRGRVAISLAALIRRPRSACLPYATQTELAHFGLMRLAGYPAVASALWPDAPCRIPSCLRGPQGRAASPARETPSARLA